MCAVRRLSQGDGEHYLGWVNLEADEASKRSTAYRGAKDGRPDTRVTAYFRALVGAGRAAVLGGGRAPSYRLARRCAAGRRLLGSQFWAPAGAELGTTILTAALPPLPPRPRRPDAAGADSDVSVGRGWAGLRRHAGRHEPVAGVSRALLLLLLLAGRPVVLVGSRGCAHHRARVGLHEQA